jgi:hypothetical protein
MKPNPILFHLAIIAGILLIASLPPLAHRALADDDDDNAAETAKDNSSTNDEDKDNDKQADKDQNDADNADMDKNDKEDQPEEKATKTKPSSPQSAETPAPVSGNWWHPHPGTSWHVQYMGKINLAAKVAAYDLDLFDIDAPMIETLHGRGVKVICYFSAGSFEGWRPDVKRFPASVLGRALTGWKYEKWLDIRKIDILKPIMEGRIKMAAQKGCDAVDPDNVEGYDNQSGFGLTYKDQIIYNKMISNLAHSAGLAVGLKNDLDQVDDLLPYFDFQVNEQCFEYHSCNQLIPFIKADKPVFNIEYNIDMTKFCPQANAMNFDSVKKDLDLGPKAKNCR